MAGAGFFSGLSAITAINLLFNEQNTSRHISNAIIVLNAITNFNITTKTNDNF
jgi:hypothetical protein